MLILPSSVTHLARRSELPRNFNQSGPLKQSVCQSTTNTPDFRRQLEKTALSPARKVPARAASPVAVTPQIQKQQTSKIPRVFIFTTAYLIRLDAFICPTAQGSDNSTP